MVGADYNDLNDSPSTECTMEMDANQNEFMKEENLMILDSVKSDQVWVPEMQKRKRRTFGQWFRKYFLEGWFFI